MICKYLRDGILNLGANGCYLFLQAQCGPWHILKTVTVCLQTILLQSYISYFQVVLPSHPELGPYFSFLGCKQHKSNLDEINERKFVGRTSGAVDQAIHRPHVYPLPMPGEKGKDLASLIWG